MFSLFSCFLQKPREGMGKSRHFPGPIIRSSLLPFPYICLLPCPWHCPHPQSVYFLSLFSTLHMPVHSPGWQKNNSKKSLLLKPAIMRFAYAVFLQSRISGYTNTPYPIVRAQIICTFSCHSLFSMGNTQLFLEINHLLLWE